MRFGATGVGNTCVSHSSHHMLHWQCRNSDPCTVSAICYCQCAVRIHDGMSAAMSSTCDEELPPPLECARLRRRPLGCDPGSWWPRPVLGEARPWEGDWATGVAAPLATPAWGDAMSTSPPVGCLRPAVLPDLVLLPADSAVPAQVRSVQISTSVAVDLALDD